MRQLNTDNRQELAREGLIMGGYDYDFYIDLPPAEDS